MERHDFDSPWKEALVKFLPQFFEFFFPEIHLDVDWSQDPKFMDKELQSIEPESLGGRRVVDTLVELCHLSGQRAWVLVHIEVQSQKQSRFAERMFLYHARIYERYRRPVCSLAILADKQARWRPEAYVQSLWGTRTEMHFPTIKLLDYRERLAELETSLNPFALMVAATLHTHATSVDSAARREAKFRLLRGLYRAGLSREEIRGLFRLVDWIMKLSKEQEIIFEQVLSKLEKESDMPYITSIERNGIAKGLKQGLERGLRQSVFMLLEVRFGSVPENVQRSLDAISEPERLRTLLKEAALAETIEAFADRV